MLVPLAKTDEEEDDEANIAERGEMQEPGAAADETSAKYQVHSNSETPKIT